MNDRQRYVEWFRSSAPYINAHRRGTFVIGFGGEAVCDPAFPNLIHDIALLDTLGIRLVLVHGIGPQLESGLRARGLEMGIRRGVPIADERALEVVKQAAGQARLDIEALLSMGLPNSPMAGARIRVASGNFVTARPLGVRDGVDYHLSGEVRRIDARSIERHLGDDVVVVVSPVGFSPTGEMFFLDAADVAIAVAIELRAAKLIFLCEALELTDGEGRPLRELTLEEAKRLLAERRHDTAGAGRNVLEFLERAVHGARNGVRRVHLIDRKLDGGLLSELFTRDGVGVMINADVYENTRRATIDDVGGILELIEPLEADGTLVRRSREKLETEIDRFWVMERDGTVIGCAALYPLNANGDMELACVAVHRGYRDAGRGKSLLDAIERSARAAGGRRLIVLTTRTTHWFRENGFAAGTIDDLPCERKVLYNYQRNSKVLMKELEP